MHNAFAMVDQKPKALRARMRMMNSRPLHWPLDRTVAFVQTESGDSR
jgi:hypothetical protein